MPSSQRVISIVIFTSLVAGDEHLPPPPVTHTLTKPLNEWPLSPVHTGNKVERIRQQSTLLPICCRFRQQTTFNKVDSIEFNFVASVYRALQSFNLVETFPQEMPLLIDQTWSHKSAFLISEKHYTVSRKTRDHVFDDKFTNFFLQTYEQWAMSNLYLMMRQTHIKHKTVKEKLHICIQYRNKLFA